MDLFISKISPEVTAAALRAKIQDTLLKPECWSTTMLGGTPVIREFTLRFWRNRNDANSRHGMLTLHDVSVALRFLDYVARNPITILAERITFTRSITTPDAIDIEILAAKNFEAEGEAALAARRTKKKKTLHKVYQLECGSWRSIDYASEPTFTAYYRNPSPSSEIRFYEECVVLTINDADKTEVVFLKDNIRSIVAQPGNYPAVTFTLNYPPRFHKLAENSEHTVPGRDNNNNHLNGKSNSIRYYRTTAIDEAHEEVAPYCFTYRVLGATGNQGLQEICFAASRWHLPTAEWLHTRSEYIPQGPIVMHKDREQLKYLISKYDFAVAFQLEALYINGCMLPSMVRLLLPTVDIMVAKLGSKSAASVLQEMVDASSAQSPTDDVQDWTLSSLCGWIRDRAQVKYWTQGRTKKLSHSNLVSIHKLHITPAGRYLSGPNLESPNRVLRMFKGEMDNFLRVEFVEEDGADFIIHDGVNFSNSLFENRYKKLFQPYPQLLQIGNKSFNFLGFSQSSLRNHSCWFMAPIEADGKEAVDVLRLIADIGDFSKITVPAKFAARMGQAFTDTVDVLEVSKDIQYDIPDIKTESGRIFSDGLGMISYELLRKIWKKRGNDPTKCPPTVYQIRFGGCKGVVALHPLLQGEMLCIRPSMRKFPAPLHRRFEICQDNKTPLPMFLNRPLVKILEDLGVFDKSLLDLQAAAVAHLREVQDSSLKAYQYLYLQNVGNVMHLPYLYKALETEVGVSFNEDPFLRRILNYALLIRLRDIKYRTRIKVDKGWTLLGIVDEFGYLQEGEVYIPTEVVDEKTSKVIRTVITGDVIVTRSPVYHPGDVRQVEAVDVPEGHPLQEHRNCIVFSQHGERDLPSMLSGGDLDGDLYNVIFDPTIRLTKQAEPMNYPRAEARSLQRPVTQEDIGLFFLKFMINDRLGQISTYQQIIADQKREGIFDPECVHLARLASTAVDFPKTGVEVNPSEIPRPRPYRPDFMAPRPHVFIQPNDIFFEERTNKYGNDDPDRSDSESESESEPNENSNNGTREGGATPQPPPAESNPKRRERLIQQVARRRRHCRSNKITYYKSNKILGKLFHAIDESTFIKDMNKVTENRLENELYTDPDAGSVLSRVLEWVCESAGIAAVAESFSGEFVEFAKDLRNLYEINVRSIMRHYSPSRTVTSISEAEVIGGFIIGKGDFGRLTRRQREDTNKLREEATELFQAIVSALQKRDTLSLFNDYNEQSPQQQQQQKNKSVSKLLPKCIACIRLAIAEEIEIRSGAWAEKKRNEIGGDGYGYLSTPLQGFGWIAASMAMKELERKKLMADIAEGVVVGGGGGVSLAGYI